VNIATFNSLPIKQADGAVVTVGDVARAAFYPNVTLSAVGVK
jgi:hypothetical protein